ncbi:type IX secretion system membrane protein PorP/SprF [Flagellimonas allohymeniacidonis]|uniref:Type IX secretion system membrane protein PorP/SprF n=1 Tax=Flagellimonas allohymeniacidonis TaxID=2517819 RepID=A0A4Q8QGQ7_9FLAO|nr:type IX secretion system membrane protein PorP/SprF [Allomuricauda hymeniacidonis]TAI47569.1 type IX secretion system membrane protein PorP/SprF [Allomuricauda hymeniacidonis]
MRLNKPILLLLLTLLCSGLKAQEENPFVVYDVPSQNLLKFNRFLINPTFSTVREDKSYINLFHRNQSVSFDDNNQIYFLSYSGRVGDRSGVGLSLFTNREGLFNNFGLHANYAYGVRLSPKSNFTFGANFSYYQSAFNQNRANAVEDDPFLNSLESSSLILFQPGFNISFGKFDFGGFAENLFDYNLKNSESITDFNEKTYSGHIQYTHQFKNGAGILEQGRLMPLARVRMVGEEDITLGGSLVMDLPKLGWVQAGYDDFYGASAGLGFNLNKNLSLGYTVEKGLTNNFENFGVSHEVSLAYSFTPNLTEDRVLLEKDGEELVENDETPTENLTLSEKDLEIAQLREKLAENDAILDELLFRQDSIETTRRKDLERRFETVMKMVRRETNGERPDLEKRAEELYFTNMDSTGLVAKNNTRPISNSGLANTMSTKKVIRLDNSSSKGKFNNQSSTKDRTYTASRRSTKKVLTRHKEFDMPNVENGHYLIANVFRNEENLNRFLGEMRARGIEADYFVNPKNDLKYVYVERSGSRREIAKKFKGNVDGKFDGPMWVMTVQNPSSNTSQVAFAKPKKKRFSKKNMVKTFEVGGIGSGFYIVAEVFDRSSEARRHVRKLKSEGVEAKYFVNPVDGKRYVYIERHDTWTNALTSYYNELNHSYEDEMWIVRIKPNYTS